MDQAEYNRKVQYMQQLAISAGLEHRVRPIYREEVLEEARFEIYYGGWGMLGRQVKPFEPDCKYYFYDDDADRLTYRLAKDIAS